MEDYVFMDSRLAFVARRFFYPVLLLLLIAQQDIIMRMLQSSFY